MAIALDLSTITPEIKAEITRVCIIKPSASQYNDDPAPVVCFATNTKDEAIYIPMGAWRNFLLEFPERSYPSTNVICKKTLYSIDTDPKKTRDQDILVAEAIKKLKEDHSVFIAAFTGYGKTTVCNYFTAFFKLKTAVICHIDTVNEQWVEEFRLHSTAKVQRVKGKEGLDPTADVYVFGVQKAAGMSREELECIGLVIFDEAHIATVTAFTKSLLRFQPKYVIGLSATPKRSDGMHKMLTMYFGPKTGFIVREEVKDFTVYKVETPYKPTIRYNIFQGRATLDWTTLVNSIAYNEERQDYIVGLVLAHPDHRIMILSDRQEECDHIYTKLIEKEETSVLKLTGAKNTIKRVCDFKDKGGQGCTTKPSFNFGEEENGRRCAKHREVGMVNVSKKVKTDTTKYRVLVAGIKKAGVGFNDPTLTMLILAADRQDVIQFEGRIRTTNNIIYDLVDDYKTLETHWEKRGAWYEKRGAVIEVVSLRSHIPPRSKVPQRRMLPSNLKK